MKKSEIRIMPEYFDSYIKEVEDIELSEALKNYGTELIKSFRKELIDTGDRVYAEGKWTVKQIIQHLIDCERIFCYRALTFARKDNTSLPGFEENDYAVTSDADRRSIDEIIADFENSRNSTLKLFESFTDEMLLSEGTCNNKKITVLATGFVIAGHTIHHMKVIKERYFSLNSVQNI